MDALSEFVASAIEFLVGGVLVTIPLIFFFSEFANSINPNQFANALMAYTTIVTMVAIALTYAVGVIAESLARALFEPLLDRITLSHDDFQTPGSLDAQTRDERLRMTKKERERQRILVMRTEPALHAEIQGQLKRLRLERVATLSLILGAIAASRHGAWSLLPLLLGGAAILTLMVNVRFGRYCGSISRSAALLAKEAA